MRGCGCAETPLLISYPWFGHRTRRHTTWPNKPKLRRALSTITVLDFSPKRSLANYLNNTFQPKTNQSTFTSIAMAAAGKPVSTTASKAPASATASKAPAKTVADKKTAKKSTSSGADGEKKKKRKVRRETYGSYIYKGIFFMQ